MTKDETNILKGIGIILMYFQHLFAEKANFEGMGVVFDVFTEAQTVKLAIACKVCVAIFVFATAYGMTKSIHLKKLSSGKELSGYSVERYLKLMMGFWFIFVIAQATSFLGNRYQVYGEELVLRIKYLVIDFFGMASLFGTPTLNATWWYMYLAVILIFVIPVLYFMMKKFGGGIMIPLAAILPVSMGFNIGNNCIYYLLTSVLGIAFAEYAWFERIEEWVAKKSVCRKCILGLVTILVCIVLLRVRMSAIYTIMLTIFDALFTVIMAIISKFIISKIPIICNVIRTFGKYSMDMFMIHTFIKGYYFHEFSYGWKHSILILAVLLIDTLIISFIIEWVKEKVGFNKLISLVCQKSKKAVASIL